MRGAVEAAGAVDAPTDPRPPLLGRRHTAAGAHSYHSPLRRVITTATARPCGLHPPHTYSTAHLGWPVFKRSALAGFQRSVTAQAGILILAVATTCRW